MTTGNAILSENYQQISDSILSLRQLPLGEVTIPSRDVYLNSISRAPPASGINTLGVYVAGCTKILWQWQFNGVGTAQYPVKGFQ
jgi:hypothetical protein